MSLEVIIVAKDCFNILIMKKVAIKYHQYPNHWGINLLTFPWTNVSVFHCCVCIYIDLYRIVFIKLCSLTCLLIKHTVIILHVSKYFFSKHHNTYCTNSIDIKLLILNCWTDFLLLYQCYTFLHANFYQSFNHFFKRNSWVSGSKGLHI